MRRDGAVANIPPWFPGATFKKDALRSQELSTRSVDGPFEYVRKSMVRTMNSILLMLLNDPLTQESGSFAKSMVSDLLDKLDGTKERTFQEKAIKECAATVYVGMYGAYVGLQDLGD